MRLQVVQSRENRGIMYTFTIPTTTLHATRHEGSRQRRRHRRHHRHQRHRRRHNNDVIDQPQADQVTDVSASFVSLKGQMSSVKRLTTDSAAYELTFLPYYYSDLGPIAGGWCWCVSFHRDLQVSIDGHPGDSDVNLETFVLFLSHTPARFYLSAELGFIVCFLHFMHICHTRHYSTLRKMGIIGKEEEGSYSWLAWASVNNFTRNVLDCDKSILLLAHYIHKFAHALVQSCSL